MRSPAVREFRKLMRARRLSQRDAARQLGVGQATLSRLLSGTSPRLTQDALESIHARMMQMVEQDTQFYRAASAAFSDTLSLVTSADARRYLNRWLQSRSAE